MILEVILIVLAVLVVLGLLLSLLGRLVPREHVAASRVHIERPPEEVWARLQDFGSWPSWNPAVKRIERLEDMNGHPVWKMVSRRGPPMPLEITGLEPPQRLVTRIADERLPFGGTWTWEVSPQAGGSEVRITENGEVKSPLFRLLARYVFGYHTAMDSFLKALAASYGQSEARPEHGTPAGGWSPR